MTAIHAPWPDVVVDRLNRRQGVSTFHPYTCAADGTLGSVKHSDSRILVADRHGWGCTFHLCRYRQTWAHHEDVESDWWDQSGDAGAHDATADQAGQK